MNPEIKNKWTEALRSGKYRQGNNALAGPDDNKHLKRCCLGVLCEVMGAKRIHRSGIYPAIYSYGGVNETDFLPNPLAEEVGLTRNTQANLVNMNDGNHPFYKSLSFKQIADWIDTNL